MGQYDGEREEAEHLLRHILPATYPEYADKSIKVTVVTSRKKGAHLAAVPREHFGLRDWDIKLGINAAKWGDWSPEKKVEVILHEATHIQHNHHKPRFWTTVARNLVEVRDTDALAQFYPDLMWDEVIDRTIRKITRANLDLRTKPIAQMRWTLYQQLDPGLTFWTYFDASTIAFVMAMTLDRDTRLPVADMDIPDLTADKAMQWLDEYARKAPYIDVEQGSYYMRRLPYVTERDDMFVPSGRDELEVAYSTIYCYVFNELGKPQFDVNIIEDGPTM